MRARLHPEISDISEDMWKDIDKIIEKYREIPGSLISVLRECQNIVGYLPKALLGYIAEGLNIPESEVFGVASFYALFSFVPKGKHIIKVCMGTACFVKGIKEVINRICYEYNLEEGGTSQDRRFSLETVRCLGACGLAPVMVVDDDTHGHVTPDEVKDILENYK